MAEDGVMARGVACGPGTDVERQLAVALHASVAGHDSGDERDYSRENHRCECPSCLDAYEALQAFIVARPDVALDEGWLDEDQLATFFSERGIASGLRGPALRAGPTSGRAPLAEGPEPAGTGPEAPK